MQLDPKTMQQIHNNLLNERIDWAQAALDRLKDELYNDPTGTVKNMMKHWTAIRAGFRWAREHNTVKMWEKELKKYDIAADGSISRSEYDTNIGLPR